MSKNKKQEENSVIDVQDVIYKSEDFVNRNKNILIGGVIGIVLIIMGYLWWSNKQEEKNESGLLEIWKSEYYLGLDSIDAAIDGRGDYYGLYDISEEYDGTDAGNLAKYYLGTSLIKKGEFEEAIEYLSDCSFDDVFLESIRNGAIGDAYVELEEYDNASEAFEAAVGASDNEFTAPIFLFKGGLIEEELGNHEKAAKLFARIKDDFPQSDQARDAKKAYARNASKQ